ncbi:polymorphic toxin type 50 domain-containing protein [Planococcus sp. NCCP-2050]|uniref:polymorphic toxin type 50 domain-containing protein n=1 Tax=Planococcus sp. NCCP-2050 TaxID=2944679 RepID=UPI00203D2732|nr:polymorphic toxin type 50 domain-containing protein [Planococcus sp. NCCP-2050]GKW46910.1 hypothetical protein NCCP2050_26020 [Planococcus sp. NCCP-2050]
MRNNCIKLFMVFSILLLGLIFTNSVSASTGAANDTLATSLTEEDNIATMGNQFPHRVIGPTGVSFPKSINIQKQNAHIAGTYEHGRVPTNSVIGGNLDFARHLLNTHGGTGKWQNANKEVFIHSTNIGRTVNPQTGIATLTRKGTIHYSNTGAHIVPAPFY